MVVSTLDLMNVDNFKLYKNENPIIIQLVICQF